MFAKRECFEIYNWYRFITEVRKLHKQNPNHVILKINYRLARNYIFLNVVAKQKNVYMTSNSTELQEFVELQKEINSKLREYLEKLSHN